MVKNSLSVILETNKLADSTYNDRLRNLKIVLDSEKRTYILTQSPLDAIPDDVTEDMQEIVNSSVLSELQKSHEQMKHANEIHMHLEELYSVQTRYECYNISKELLRARIVEGSSVMSMV
ncbi:hypothetical protein CDL12_13416 [Handroanthus impetiginosus]|uniref:Uncharacterized protein n=1 Tax=Handroanthus impetiginosus TaxID=429701 RepID=A0A2G9H8X2_9LAMI|nr:hypothetical protein CDL12_13416 [Handroanthus impetiginosus]